MKSILLLLVAVLSLTACEQEDSGYSYDFPTYDPSTDPVINDYLRNLNKPTTTPISVADALIHQPSACPNLDGSYEFESPEGKLGLFTFTPNPDRSLEYSFALENAQPVDGETEFKGMTALCNSGNILIKVREGEKTSVVRIEPATDGSYITVGAFLETTGVRYDKNVDFETVLANHKASECPDLRGEYSDTDLPRSSDTTFGRNRDGDLTVSDGMFTYIANGTLSTDLVDFKEAYACNKGKLLIVGKSKVATTTIEIFPDGDSVSVYSRLLKKTKKLRPKPSI